ncbi:hypothetical protein [Sphingobacterium kitahiroshimense]|uniref:DUF3592 domain-containing protein n=1 Tax=Sphingobacterium kitahiroshimense TaxID=470446 RepID=A0ABV0C031_9SPHI
MDFILILLSHLWAILGIIATIYCFLAVRKSKFIVVTEFYNRIIELPKELDVKLNDKHLLTNLHYYRLVICYAGLNDIKGEEVKIPFTISNPDPNCKWHNIKIIKCSSTFKPKLSIKNNKFYIQNSLIKNGDSLILEFFIETKNESLSFINRIANVAINSSIHNQNKKTYLTGFILGIITSILIGALLHSSVKNYTTRNNWKEEYNTEYRYKGQIIYKNHSFDSNYSMDSLILDEFKQKNVTLEYPNNILTKAYSNSERLDLINKVSSHNVKYFKSIDSLDNAAPSLKAKALYSNLKKSKNIEFNKIYSLEKNLDIRFINPRDSNWKDDLRYYLLFILISPLLVISILYVSYCGINYFSTLRAYRALK